MKKNNTIVKDNTTKRNKRFERICRMDKDALKIQLEKELISIAGKDKVIFGDGYLYMEGKLPIILTAHMDTVHKELPSEIIYENGKISSPQGIGGDDRCGIYMIMEIIKTHRCHVLFFEEEEVGGIGSNKFTKTSLCEDLKGNIKYCIDLDRKGSDDSVFYDLDNEDFEDFVNKEFWKDSWGSFTDICNICPALDCAGVNLSCGYYNAHTTSEYVVLTEMENSITEVKKLINRSNTVERFDWKEKKRVNFFNTYKSYNNYDYKYGWQKASVDEYCIVFMGQTGEEYYKVVAESEEEALGFFFIENPTKCFNDVIDYGYADEILPVYGFEEYELI